MKNASTQTDYRESTTQTEEFFKEHVSISSINSTQLQLAPTPTLREINEKYENLVLKNSERLQNAWIQKQNRQSEFNIECCKKMHRFNTQKLRKPGYKNTYVKPQFTKEYTDLDEMEIRESSSRITYPILQEKYKTSNLEKTVDALYQTIKNEKT